jgi:hypothetical protein
MTPSDCILFSGGAPGAEAAFGALAERHGVEEVNFTFEGHRIERQRGIRVLNHEELLAGDVSLEYVSRLMRRRYSEGPTIRKILQTLWYQVNSGQEVYVIGAIRRTTPSAGGRGGARSSRNSATSRCTCSTRIVTAGSAGPVRPGRPMSGDRQPLVTHPHFTGTGTRTLRENGRRAIEALFARSFQK